MSEQFAADVLADLGGGENITTLERRLVRNLARARTVVTRTLEDHVAEMQAKVRRNAKTKLLDG